MLFVCPFCVIICENRNCQLKKAMNMTKCLPSFEFPFLFSEIKDNTVNGYLVYFSKNVTLKKQLMLNFSFPFLKAVKPFTSYTTQLNQINFKKRKNFCFAMTAIFYKWRNYMLN